MYLAEFDEVLFNRAILSLGNDCVRKEDGKYILYDENIFFNIVDTTNMSKRPISVKEYFETRCEHSVDLSKNICNINNLARKGDTIRLDILDIHKISEELSFSFRNCSVPDVFKNYILSMDEDKLERYGLDGYFYLGNNPVYRGRLLQDMLVYDTLIWRIAKLSPDTKRALLFRTGRDSTQDEKTGKIVTYYVYYFSLFECDKVLDTTKIRTRKYDIASVTSEKLNLMLKELG